LSQIPRIWVLVNETRIRPHCERVRYGIKQRVAVHFSVGQCDVSNLAQTVVVMLENRFGQMAKENLGQSTSEALVGRHRYSLVL
jgi:hypothetical protein